MARQKKNGVETNGTAVAGRIDPDAVGQISEEALARAEAATEAYTKNTKGSYQISPPKMVVVAVPIIGTAPYVQCRFPEKARNVMEEKMKLGSLAKKGTARKARDFDEDYLGAFHRGPNNECGIPASAFRNACIRACSIVNFKMTLAKMSVFVLHDFVDSRDGTMLVRLNGTPKKVTHPVRNATGVADLRVRAMWDEWDALLKVQFDSDQFSDSDIVNLLARVGMQVGIGEGRPMSKESAGMGWGTFRLGDKITVIK